MMQIKRRVPRKNADGRAIPGKFQDVIEDVQLVHKNAKSVLVRLSNGDVILRKNKDIVLEVQA